MPRSPASRSPSGLPPAPRRFDGRRAAWSGAGLLMLLPLVAMGITDEVAWGVGDVALMGALLLGAGGACELAVRWTRSAAYRTGVGIAVATAFLLVWLNLAVGLIGSEGHPANLMYGGVLAVGFLGSLAARFRPHGMARALAATALAQALAGLVALVAGMGRPGAVLVLTAGFTALWLLAAWLFGRARTAA